MSDSVKKLQEQAAEDYRRHNSPETQAAAREQAAQARINGHDAATTWSSWNDRTGGRS